VCVATRHLRLLAGSEDVRLAAQLDAHRALEHRVVLGHADMDMRGADEALRPADHVHLGVGPAGRLVGREELHPHAQLRHFDHIARLRHSSLQYARAVTSYPRLTPVCMTLRAPGEDVDANVRTCHTEVECGTPPAEAPEGRRPARSR